jgi:hypothetical protein
MSQARGIRFIPRLGDRGGSSGRLELQFDSWWAKEHIYKDSQAELTRRRLVFALRHQDGGGHIGALTNPSYVRLKGGAGWFGGVGNGPPEQFVGAVSATMRQVAWEVTETLKQLREIA